MKEIGLQHIWEKQAFEPKHLKTSTGKNLQILHRGDWNNQNGPDFLNASVQIDSVLLFGAIEIHLKSSDWYAHQHHKDSRYNQTILHVVFDDNKICYLENGQILECLDLGRRTDITQIERQSKPSELPCASLISLCNDTIIDAQLEIALKKRFNHKAQRILALHAQWNSDWWYTAFGLIFSAWMGKANQAVSEIMVHNIHKTYLMRNRNSLSTLAYMFGQAGWLNHCETDINNLDHYCLELADNYKYLCIKFNYECSESLPWNNRQLRPHSFPHIRMAQFSGWISAINGDLSDIFSPKHNDLSHWIEFFTADTDPYWQTHFVMNKVSAVHHSSNGREHAKQVITNGLIPFLYTFGLESHKPQLIELAQALLQQLPAEDNQTTRKLKLLKSKHRTAKESQSLIAQYQHYCTLKQCKNCRVGNHILNLPFMGAET